MGEYFSIVNLDKEEFLHPHKLGSGLKFYELIGNRASGVLLYLLSPYTNDREYKGSWYGDRIIMTGDYDDTEYSSKCREPYEDDGEHSSDFYTDISLGVRKEMADFDDFLLYQRWDVHGEHDYPHLERKRGDVPMRPDIVLGLK